MSTKVAKDVTSLTFDEGEMTVKQFKRYLTQKFGSTLNDKPFETGYVYSIINYRHLPRHLGGNKLSVRVMDGIRLIKILPEKYDFYAKGRGKAKKEKRVKK